MAGDEGPPNNSFRIEKVRAYAAIGVALIGAISGWVALALQKAHETTPSPSPTPASVPAPASASAARQVWIRILGVESPYLYDDPIKIFFNVNGVPYVYPTETDQAGAAREMSVASYPVSINDQPYRVKFRIITPKMTNFVSEYVSNELMTVKEVPSGVQSYRLFSKEGSASHYNNKLSAAVRFEITY